MKRRLPLFILAVAALVLGIFRTPAVDLQNAFAQGKPADAKVTFVEIGSVNCIPCRAMQPIMKEVEEEFKGQIKVVFYDVWTPKGKADAAKYNIRVIPTQVFLDKDGKEYFRHEGYFPKEGVVQAVRMQGVR